MVLDTAFDAQNAEKFARKRSISFFAWLASSR